jgi:hypothetical protein
LEPNLPAREVKKRGAKDPASKKRRTRKRKPIKPSEINFAETFKALDKLTTKRGVPVGTWVLEPEEAKTLKEVSERFDDSKAAAVVSRILDPLMVALVLAGIFVPRISATLAVVAPPKPKQNKEGAQNAGGNASTGISGTGEQANGSVAALDSAAPWRRTAAGA